MPVKFYKKLTPGNPVVLEFKDQPSVLVHFTSLDGLIGYYASDQEEVHRQLENFMRQQRYGLTEISEKEFHENYVQKKNQPEANLKSWREEMSGSSARGSLGQETVSRLGSERVRAAVAVSALDGRPKAERIAVENTSMEGPTVVTTAEPVKPEFKPAVAKRKPLKA